MVPVGVIALEDFLGTVDEDRDDAFIDEVIVFCRLYVACLLRDCILSQAIADLAADANGVNTLKQFAAVKFDDIEWPPLAQAGKKGFVRLAIRMYKATHGA